MSAIDAPLDLARLVREAPEISVDQRFTFEWKAATRSTNDDVRSMALAGAPEGRIVVADEQSAGRGRRGNVWIAPARRCLLVSMLLRPAQETALWPRVTHLAALAMCRTFESFLPEEKSPRVKWPNDVLVGNRKVSGILLESAASSKGGFLVLGLGINVNVQEADFPDELKSSASSLLIEAGETIDRTSVLLRFLKEFSDLYPSSLEDFDPALDEIHRRSSLNGKKVSLTSSGLLITGRVIGFGGSGELRLEKDDGTEMLVSSGELVRETLR